MSKRNKSMPFFTTFLQILTLAGVGFLIWEALDIKRLEGQMAADLTAITAQVAATTDAEQAAVILLGQLKTLLDAAGTDPVKLAALSTSLGTNTDALAAAIVANTPAA